jgi:hypothetical protein
MRNNDKEMKDSKDLFQSSAFSDYSKEKEELNKCYY